MQTPSHNNDDRREERPERVSVRIPVELGFGDFDDAIEADAVNISRGGLSMRSPCLPDVGERLKCRFVCEPSGAVVTAEGEVVWAHLDRGDSGELGLAFVDLDGRTEMLLEEMIAEHAAHAPAGVDPADVAAPVARLELEGSSEPIEARVARERDGRVVFEQQLDLLALGRGVRAPELGADHGSIAGVELRMMGNVPTLAVTVAFDGAEPAYGEFEWDEQSVAGQLTAGDAGRATPDGVHDRDTEPDLMAPPAQHGASGETTLNEFGEAAQPEAYEDDHVHEVTGARLDAPAAASDEELHDDYEDEHADAPLQVRVESPLPASAERSAPQAALEADARPEQVELPLTAEQTTAPRPASVGGDLAAPHLDDDEDLGPDFEELGRSPLAARMQALGVWSRAALRATLAFVARVHGRIAPVLHRALPQLRGGWLRLRGAISALYRTHLASSVGAARRLALGRLQRKRRRKTAAPGKGGRRSTAPGVMRTVVLGLLGAAGIALGVYALSPGSADDGLELHRKVAPKAQAVAAGEAEAAAAGAPAKKPEAKPDANEALARPEASAVPSSDGLPDSSPFAVDVRGQEKTGPTVPARKILSNASGKRFGASEVSDGRSFTLRMSTPIDKLEGVADAGGFSVVIPGSLSLDRAGPISAAHPAVRRSMILNKGDHAELTIRFAAGKTPKYQVRAEGSTLHIQIGH
ncbi:MAG: PilZ domain-containing protein [Myxococcales bacterium]|jgi:hypothetical protein